jgi:geranylgeranyl pyrophosphate synthase
VPLLKDGCADTTAEVEALKELLYLNNGQEYTRTRSFLPLLRAARALFDEEPLAELLSDCTSVGSSSTEAGAATAVEGLALDWLRAGGKRFRPFITLASYAALAHDAEVLEPDADLTSRFPLAVKRIALAIEILHKASLIHDDIEDDDAYRYGRETIHRSHGTPTAINVGDYLIGLGYRLVSATRADIGAACVADILAHLAEAHLKLCRGQGAEIALTGPGSFSVRTSEVQRIYALKTAPAFEVALYAGIRAAAPEEDALPADADLLRRYCRFVGVAYQLLNDLKDWRQDNRDKLVSGQDLLAARPTLLRALLLEALDEDGKARLRKLGAAEIPAPEKIARMRRLYESMDVFQKAAALLQKYRDRARTLVDDTQPPVLAELMRFVVETVL